MFKSSMIGIKWAIIDNVIDLAEKNYLKIISGSQLSKFNNAFTYSDFYKIIHKRIYDSYGNSIDKKSFINIVDEITDRTIITQIKISKCNYIVASGFGIYFNRLFSIDKKLLYLVNDYGTKKWFKKFHSNINNDNDSINLFSDREKVYH